WAHTGRHWARPCTREGWYSCLAKWQSRIQKGLLGCVVGLRLTLLCLSWCLWKCKGCRVSLTRCSSRWHECVACLWNELHVQRTSCSGDQRGSC
ncbi:mCG1042624, partial [Mus musculus]